LAWTYRRQNLLREIVAYRADILCLQEVMPIFKWELCFWSYFGMVHKEFTAVIRELFSLNRMILR
jgi:hypothetical protein